MIGIYSFTYKDKYAYVGQSIDVENRILQHKIKIEKNIHPNMEIFENYCLSDFSFNVLEECDKNDLNDKESSYYKKLSSKYLMLNKRECGVQGIVGDKIIFNDNDNPKLEFVNDNFILDGNMIEKDEDNMYCLSNLSLYIRNNSNHDLRVNQVLNKEEFIDRINALCKCNIPKDRNTSKHLKDLGLYAVKGARDNKRIFCSFEVFITFAFYSCPQFAASICIMIGNGIK